MNGLQIRENRTLNKLLINASLFLETGKISNKTPFNMSFISRFKLNSGNLALHAITSQGLYELKVELEDWDGNKTFAQYDYFKVGSYEYKYRLAVSGYSGDAGAYFSRT